MAASSPFNIDFDHADHQELIAILQRSLGCFACNKPDPPKTCSRCKVAKYCNKECQAKDWKEYHHKEICTCWCDNRSSDESKGLLAHSIPIAMAGCDWLPEDILMKEMKHRSNLFFQEIKNCDDVKSTNLAFQSAVIEIVGGIYLVGAASFFSNSQEAVLSVNHVLFEKVDEGEEARHRLYPSNGGSGEISDNTKSLVVDKWTEFVGRMSEFDLHVSSVTFGRGLMWLSDDDDSREKIETHNGQVHGVHRRIIWMPSMDYAMTDSMSAAMEGSGMMSGLTDLMNQLY